MHLEHIKGDTWCIVTPFIRIPFYKLDDKNIVFLDSGLFDGQGRLGLLSLLKREGFNVRAVLCSHVHIDHGGNNRLFQDLYGADIYLGLYGAAIASNPLAMRLEMSGDSLKEISQYAETLACRADEMIPCGGGVLTVEGATFEVVDLPGHAPEHFGIVTPDDVFYVADALLSHDVLSTVSIAHCKNVEHYLASMQKIKERRHDYYVLAHNRVYDHIGWVVDENAEAQMRRAQILKDLLNRPLSMEEIVKAGMGALGSHGDTLARFFVVEGNIGALVEYLLDRGEVVNRVHEGRVQYVRAELA